MARVMLKPKSKYQKYFNPKRIGENVEGNIINQVEDEYGNTRLVLDVGTDENGDFIVVDPNGFNSFGKSYDQRHFTQEEIESVAAGYTICTYKDK